MEQLPAEWRKCFSVKRKRAYYFNQTTGESLWTLEEVMAKSGTMDKKPAPSDSDETIMPNLKRKNKEKHTPSTSTSTTTTTKAAVAPKRPPPEDTIEDIPMEIDDVVENIQRIRSDTATYEKTVSSVKATSHPAKRVEIKRVKQIIVLDTNILISNLSEISLIGKTKSSEIIVSIPWVVMQELDGLKSRVQANLNKKAQQAILHLNSILKSKSVDNYIFEDSVQNENGLIKCEKPDDKIIRCALNLKKQYQQFPVTIISNDVNLINKSLITKVNALNFESFHETVSANKHNKTGSKQSYVTPAAPVSTQKFQELLERLSDLLFERIDSNIVWTLGYFYEFEMKKAYGDVWYDMAKQKKPWTIYKLVVNLNKTFNALFCFTANRKQSHDLQNSFKSFKNLVISNEELSKKIGPSSKLKNLIDTAVEFKTMISKFKTDGYDPGFEKKLANLELCMNYALVYTSSRNCMESFDALSKVNANTTLEGNNEFEKFEKIWQMYNSTSMISSEIESNSHNGAACNNIELLYHYVICHLSIDHLSSIYESVLVENSETNLTTLCKLIYILCQLFDTRVIQETGMKLVAGEEHLKYAQLRKSVQSILGNLSHRQTMSNALAQLKDYQTRFSLVDVNKLKDLIKDC